jgi:sirohydrochlorin ferrochelatase
MNSESEGEKIMEQHATKSRVQKLFRILDPVTVTAIALISVLLYAALWNPAFGAAAKRGGDAPATSNAGVGFLVVAPDRGFQGNEEIRDAFEAFARRHNAALAVATDERTRGTFAQALDELKRRGARRTVVLPLFLSANDPRFGRVRALVAERGDARITVARTFGESYLAVEALADRLRALPEPQGRRVIIAGYGADSPETRARLEADWERLAQHAAAGLPFESVRALVWYDVPAAQREERGREMQSALAQAATGGERVVLVPFHLGKKLDGMMAFSNELKRIAPAGVEMLAEEPLPAVVGTWMEREANRALPLESKDIGVVVLAHGSDYHWNETMRQAARPLEARYPVEYCFSMADPPLIERSVRRLESRGVRAIVIVRVFGLTDSFEGDIERLFGLDIEAPRATEAHAMHMHDDHGHGTGAPLRIHTAAIVRSAGGVEDHPLFAQALLERARALSKDPVRETVILTAHGSGDDARNARWIEVLESLAKQMRARGGQTFRAIHIATWREDWPGKREPWIAKTRAMVEEATGDGGRALVIPARTNAQGPERVFLKGLSFELGEGFAPYPLFARWVEEQVKNGISAIAERAVTQNAATQPGANDQAITGSGFLANKSLGGK